MTQKPVLHLFDLDRTITRLPTYSSFLIHAALRIAPWRLLLIPALVPFFAGYGVRLIDRKSLKQVMQRLMLGSRVSQERVARVTASFARRTVESNSYAAAKHLIHQAQSAGERVVIATASHLFYAGAIAARLSVTNVIATGSVWQDGALTPEIPGDNCYGAAKLAMVKAWFAAHDIDRTAIDVRFYSDHISDLPTFEWCDQPVAIHPSAKLRALAVARGWTILDWR